MKKRNILACMLIICLMALTFTGCGTNRNDDYKGTTAAKTTESTKDRDGLMDDIKDGIEDIGDDIKDGAKDVKRGAEDMMGDTTAAK